MSPVSFGKPVVEPVESRRLMAAVYDVGALTGYITPDVFWSYNYSYQYAFSGSGAAESGAAAMTVSATRSGPAAKPKWTLASASAARFGANVKVLRQNRQGLSLLNIQTGLENVGISVAFTDLRLAPTTLAVGKSFTDVGRFTGNLGGPEWSLQLPGISGTARVTTRLINAQSLPLAGRMFKTVKGSFNLSLAGTLEVNDQHPAPAHPFTATRTNTFWASPGKGIVRQRETAVVTITFPTGAATLTLSNSADLVSRTAATRIFSSRPIRAS